ncbi:MAG: PorT family protein [Sphingobacteriales bacterium]|nr:MAG: PorT family protein [Sphingobacteriales bacterium]
MKKIYSILAFALVSGSVVMAQSNDGVKFGVRAGVNLATVAISGDGITSEDKDGIKSLTSFNFGGYADIPVSGKFSIQPGLSLSGKGFKVTEMDSFEDEEEGGMVSQTINIKTNIMYLELPLNAVFNFNGFYFGAGPYLAYGLSGKVKVESKATIGNFTMNASESESIKFGSKEDEIRALDYGFNGLVGYKLENGLNFNLNYGLGLGNYNNNSVGNGKTSNRVFSFLVGFSF